MQQRPPGKRELFGWSPTALSSTIRHVGSSLASGISALTVDTSDKEKISFVKFGQLEYQVSRKAGASTVHRTVLLLGYTTGFQVWDLDSGAPTLLVSRREGPIR